MKKLLLISSLFALSGLSAKAQNVYALGSLFSYNAKIEGQAFVMGSLEGSQLDVEGIYVKGQNKISILDGDIIPLSSYDAQTFLDGATSKYFSSSVVEIREDTHFNVIAPNSRIRVSEGVTVFGSLIGKNIVLEEGAQILNGKCACVPEPTSVVMSLFGLGALLLRRKK